MTPSVAKAVVVLALAALTIGVYWPVRHYDFVNFDDDDYVTANTMVQRGLTAAGIRWAWTSMAYANWHPLTWMSHMLDCELYGLQPGGHHLTNLLLHVVATLLLWLFLHLATGSIWRPGLVAAGFALHPLHVESVAWIAERKDVLSGCFWMLAMVSYVIYTRAAGRRRVAWYLATAAALALGLTAKPMLVTLPCVLLLLDYWPLERWDESKGGERLRALIVEKLPLFAICAVSGWITVIAQRSWGAVKTLESFPLSVRGGNAAVAMVVYLRKTFWPADLAVFYPHPGMLPAGTVLGAVALLAALSALVVWHWRRRWLVVGWLWFAGTLVPVLGIVQVGSQAYADRYTYTPLIGVFVVLVWGGEQLLPSWLSRRLALLAVAAMAAATWRQVSYWRDSRALFGQALRHTQNNDLAHNSYGVALADAGELDRAITHYRLALAANPRHWKAYSNLGDALSQRGDFDDAIAACQRALELNPNYMQAQYNLGKALCDRGDPAAAVPYLQQAVRLRPDSAEACNYLGIALARSGHPEAAHRAFVEALKLRPDFVHAMQNLGTLLASTGHLEAAIKTYEQVLLLTPDDETARQNLAQARADLARRLPAAE